jgi:GT2 family glycosyltransferase
MEKITFCIPTAKNEKEYIKLLLKSLENNTNINNHEVLVFIDSDNQNTYEMLLDLKKTFKNLKIYNNQNKYPIGGQRNISVMFNAANNDIVCYLQSDMVVGPDFDKHILKHIELDNVLSCARIEPPLHPESPEKIVKDFGITPEDFKYNDFINFVKKVQKENRPVIDGHFAPFAVYKKTWFEKLGGFDTQFRCSREDSDMIIRLKANKLKTIQTWDACVYHFTCVSSRGVDWFKKDLKAEYKNQLQSLADQQELKRFIRKWGYFGHDVQPVYNTSLVLDIDQFADINLLKSIEPYFKKIYINDQDIANQLKDQINFESYYYANLRWNYTKEYWDSVKHLFNSQELENHINYGDASDTDIVVNVKYSDLINTINTPDIQNLITKLNQIVDSIDIGTYQIGDFIITINKKEDISKEYYKVNINQMLIESNFIFK